MALRLPPRLMFLLATASGTVATLAVVGLPFARFAYRAPDLHVALETGAALIAGLAAYIVLGWYVERGALRDLLLGCGLAVTAFVNLALAAASGSAVDSAPAAAWAGAGGRLVAASLIAGAAFAPAWRAARPASTAAVALVGSVGAVALLAALLAVFSAELPSPIDPSLAPEESAGPRFVGHPLVHAVQLAGAVLFAAAAMGFGRRALRTGEPLAFWLALGAVAATFAALHYALFPSLYSEWVYTGDAFRLAFFLFLLVGAGHEIRAYQRRAEEAAALEERRRIARDLHDGLAHELAYVVREAGVLARSGRTELGRLAAAAERALDESRRAIAALTNTAEEPLDVVLAQAAEDVASRAGAEVSVRADGTAEVAPAVREQLARIVREAVTNAVRHGRATHVALDLVGGAQLRVRIVDNGIGFDVAAAHGGFGLTSMRERAGLIGGELAVRSRASDGTEVELVLDTAAT